MIFASKFEAIDNYDFTGECRHPRIGEVIFYDGMAVQITRLSEQYCGQVSILRKKGCATTMKDYNLTIPDGYEPTGEYRKPNKNDMYLYQGVAIRAGGDANEYDEFFVILKAKVESKEQTYGFWNKIRVIQMLREYVKAAELSGGLLTDTTLKENLEYVSTFERTHRCDALDIETGITIPCPKGYAFDGV